MVGKFRGPTKWDPSLIICQIVTVQSFNYVSLCLLLLIASTLSDLKPSISFIFDHRTLSTSSASTVVVAHLVNAFSGAYVLTTFVSRSKSCLDFSITYHTIHFLGVCYYSGSLPDTSLWYLINILGACVMCITSELLCRREESTPIQL